MRPSCACAMLRRRARARTLLGDPDLRVTLCRTTRTPITLQWRVTTSGGSRDRSPARMADPARSHLRPPQHHPPEGQSGYAETRSLNRGAVAAELVRTHWWPLLHHLRAGPGRARPLHHHHPLPADERLLLLRHGRASARPWPRLHLERAPHSVLPHRLARVHRRPVPGHRHHIVHGGDVGIGGTVGRLGSSCSTSSPCASAAVAPRPSSPASSSSPTPISSSPACGPSRRVSSYRSSSPCASCSRPLAPGA